MKKYLSKKLFFLITTLFCLTAAIIAAVYLVPIIKTKWKNHQIEQQISYPKDIEDKANALHKKIITFDSHIDIPLELGTASHEVNKDGEGEFDLVKVKKSPLSGAALTLWSWPDLWSGPNPPNRPTPAHVENAKQELEARYKIITSIARDFPDEAGIAHSPDEFRQLVKAGKFAIFISFLNAYPLGNDISQLDKWAARGMRMFGFNYIANNDWSDSSRPMYFYGDVPNQHNGLTDTGKRAIQRLNELGVIIDVSQMSSKALLDVSTLTKAPLVASHSALRSIVNIDRNLSDEELQLIKKSGGVVQIVAFSTYIKPLSPESLEKIAKLRNKFGLQTLQNPSQALMPSDPILAIWPEQKFAEYAQGLYGIHEEEPKATVKDFVDSIDYAVKKIGIDHVGISSDFNDGGGVTGWRNVSQGQNVTAELISRGYSDADIVKIWGGNFLRVWEQVQKTADELKSQKSIN